MVWLQQKILGTNSQKLRVQKITLILPSLYNLYTFFVLFTVISLDKMYYFWNNLRFSESVWILWRFGKPPIFFIKSEQKKNHWGIFSSFDKAVLFGNYRTEKKRDFVILIVYSDRLFFYQIYSAHTCDNYKYIILR